MKILDKFNLDDLLFIVQLQNKLRRFERDYEFVRSLVKGHLSKHVDTIRANEHLLRETLLTLAHTGGKQ